MYSTVAQAGTVHIEPIRSDQGAFIGAEVRVTKTSRTVRRNSIQGKNWISVKPTFNSSLYFPHKLEMLARLANGAGKDIIAK